LLCSQLAYELRINANRSVPGLFAIEKSGVDVEIHLNDGSEFPVLSGGEFLYTSENTSESGQPALRVGRLSGGGYGLFYSDGARFAVDPRGRAIVADWPAGYYFEDAATYLLGPVLAFVLRLRGLVCLHASAVAIEDKAIALVGSPGAGKSTAAAAFAKSGYAVLSDDVVALTEQPDCFRVRPGYPRVNLWGDSVRALFGSEDALPKITPTWDKRYLALDQDGFRFESRALPLGVIYVLRSRENGGSTYRLGPISPPSAFIALVGNTYVNYLLDKDMRSTEFRWLGRLVSSVPVRSVDQPDDASELGALIQAIAADAKEVLASRSALSVDSR
jgi:hypothetical protein